MTTLLFIRHGIPEDGSPGQRDADRALTEEGWTKTRAAMAGLVRLGPRPTHGLVSPYRRAQETLQALQEAAGDFPVDTWTDLVPEASPQATELAIRAHVAELPEDAVVAVVGHQPLTGELVRRFTGRQVEVKRASCSVVEVRGGVGRLLASHAPAELRAAR